MDNKRLINHIKSYSTLEWIIFIKIIENKSDEELEKIEPNEIERYNLRNSNWYSKLLDLALRLSDREKMVVKFDNIPKKQDYRKFISLYLNSYDNESNFKDDLNFDLKLALSKYGYEQLKIYQPPINDLGRLLALYEPKEDLFKEFFGLTPNQIVYFYSLNNSKHSIYEPFDFKNMLRLLNDYDNKINGKKLKKFLDMFSITTKKYRLEAKKIGITKNTMKSKRLIETYPIVAFNNGYYLIPSINILLSSLSYKIFEVINQQFKDSQRFKNNFGNTFENYVRDLTKFSHSDYFFECNELIKNDNEDKAEFYLLDNESCLVVESKLLHIDEEIILNKSAKELKERFEDTIEKALGQLGSCFKKLDIKNKYGIIVIHTHIPLLENYIQLFKYKYDFLDTVKIVSIIDYEIMIHNSYDEIIEYFQMPEGNGKRQIALHFNQRNKYCEKKYVDLINELKDNLLMRENIE
ncbi:MAG: hypothetical protein WC149_10800 [Arcobacteraceae bacterium]